MDACRDYPVIAINDAHRLAPWAPILYAADAKWWHYYQGVPAFGGLKFSLQSDAAQWPGVQVLRSTGDSGIETDPRGLRTGRNGGYQAMNLAVHCGARRIVLLGYDMQRTGDRSHWFGDHPARLQSSAPYQSFCELFKTAVAPLRALGITVINASRETALTCFPRHSLDEALG